MSVTVYGIANCDTCRKARKWLDEKGIVHTFHDVRSDGLDALMVKRWSQSIPGPELFNRRSRSWRELADTDRARADSDPEALLLAHPLLLKRPLLEASGGVLQGFRAADWAGFFGVVA